MAADYSGKLTGKQIDSLPGLIADIINGKTPAGLAIDLYSPTDVAQNNQSFIRRTSAGSDSIRNGEAYLKEISGNMVKEADINSSYESEYHLAPASFTFEVKASNVDTFVNKVSSILYPGQPVDRAVIAAGTYRFIKTETGWSFNESEVDLTEFGITVQGTAYIDDVAIAKYNYTQSSVLVEWVEFTYESNRSYSITVNLSTILSKLGLNPGESDIVNLVYNGSEEAWYMSVGTELVPIDLTEYGITIESVGGVMVDNDIVSITVHDINYGKVYQAVPTKFVAVGLNSFNKDVGILRGYTINEEGAIEAAEGKVVCFTRCIYNSSNPSYTLYDVNGTIERAGWLETEPTESSEDIVLGSTLPEISYIDFEADGYIVVACSNENGICIHPTWSGREDRTYAAYTESDIVFPADMSLWAISSTLFNTLDLTTGVLTKKVLRMDFSRDNLSTLLAAHPTWVKGTQYIHDNEYIYYKADTETEESISVQSVFFVNDYSIEEFLGTSVEVICSLMYGPNLVDKLRVDVITREVFNQIVGLLTGLTTIDKSSIVNAINEVKSEVSGTVEVGATVEEVAELKQSDFIYGYFKEVPTLCGQPMILQGAGTPQESIVPVNWKQFNPETGEGYNWNGLPSALNQIYINTSVSTNGGYIAVRDGQFGLKWVQL